MPKFMITLMTVNSKYIPYKDILDHHSITFRLQNSAPKLLGTPRLQESK